MADVTPPPKRQAQKRPLEHSEEDDDTEKDDDEEEENYNGEEDERKKLRCSLLTVENFAKTMAEKTQQRADLKEKLIKLETAQKDCDRIQSALSSIESLNSLKICIPTMATEIIECLTSLDNQMKLVKERKHFLERSVQAIDDWKSANSEEMKTAIRICATLRSFGTTQSQ